MKCRVILILLSCLLFPGLCDEDHAKLIEENTAV